MSKKERNLTYLVFGVVIIAILGIGLFRESLFVFGDTGSIVVDHLEANSAVYIDKIESKRLGSKAEENVKLRKLNIGIHQILILRDGFWPWLKDVEVIDGGKVVLSPFSVPENSTGFLIGESDPLYESIIERFNSLIPPDFENKKVSADEQIAFWVDEETLFAEWLGEDDTIPKSFCNETECPRVTVPLTVGANIKNIDFYRGRNDVFIVSFGNGVFAIELDNRGHQNFQPIFEGKSPEFLSNNEQSIYILDEGVLREVGL
jgi:hypothetical protein